MLPITYDAYILVYYKQASVSKNLAMQLCLDIHAVNTGLATPLHLTATHLLEQCCWREMMPLL